MKKKKSESHPFAKPLAASIEHEAVAEPASLDFSAMLAACSEGLARQTWLAWLLVATPVVISLYYVHSYGVNIGWEDQLDNLVPVFQKSYAGTLHISDFWVEINEHRHFFPMITMFLLAMASGWDTVAEMYFSQALLLVLLAIVILALHRSGTKNLAWFGIPVAAMVFSLRQNQVMLNGFLIVFAMTAALSVATFFCLHLMTDGKGLRWKFACALSLAMLAGFSAAQGLFVWLVGLVQLLVLAQPRREKIVMASLWSCIGAVEWVVYFQGWVKPGWHPPFSFTWEYFLSIVGGALYPGPTLLVAETAGALLLILTVIAILLALGEWDRGKHTFWLAIILFGLITEGQTTLGRSGGPATGKWGVGQALSSRYATFSLFVVIGAYGIVSTISRKELARQAAATWGGLLGLIVLGTVLSTSEGMQVGQAWWQERDYHDYLFCTSETQPDEALPTAPWQKGPNVRNKLAFLKEQHLNVFRSPSHVASWTVPVQGLPVLPIPARVQMNQLQVNKHNGLITMSGIALDGKEDELVGGVFLDIDNILYPTYYGWPCEDVAQRLALNPEIPDLQRRIEQLESEDIRLLGETGRETVERRQKIDEELLKLRSGLADSLRQRELKASRLARCVFRRDFSVKQLGPGRHMLKIVAVSKDRNAVYRATNASAFEVPLIPDVPSKPEK